MSFRRIHTLGRPALAAGAVIACLPATTLAQPWPWVHQFGSAGTDFGRAVAPDGAGGVICVGWTDGSLGGPNAGLDDAFIVRYGVLGNQLWIHQLGTTGADALTAVTPDGAGGAHVVGYTDGVLGKTSEGARDAFLARYDGAGNLLWLTQVGSALDDEATAVVPDGAGGVFVAGITQADAGGQPNEGGSDVFLGRFDSTGTDIWFRQIGSNADDFAEALTPDGTGGVFVAGITEGDLARPNPGGEDAFLARYDGNGNQLWLVQFGAGNADHAHALATDGADGVIVVGDTNGSLGGPHQGLADGYVARYDSAGNRLWITQFGTARDDAALGAVPNGLGGVIVAGETSGILGTFNFGGFDAYLAQFHGGGAVFWIDQFGTAADDAATGLTGDGAGILIVGGITAGDLGGPNAGLLDTFLARLGHRTCPCACEFDTSTHAKVCDLIDFTTFAGLFAQGDPCACDIDISTGVGVCDLIDFTTFASQFAGGCP